MSTEVVKTYYKDQTTIKEEYFQVNGIKEGEYKKYYDNGILIETCNYFNNNREGECKTFYWENGKLWGIKYYINNKLEGKAKTFYWENGKLWGLCYYVDNKLEGEYKTYHATLGSSEDKLKSVSNYVNGVRQGVETYYHENGKLKKIINYNNGEPDDAFVDDLNDKTDDE